MEEKDTGEAIGRPMSVMLKASFFVALFIAAFSFDDVRYRAGFCGLMFWMLMSEVFEINNSIREIKDRLAIQEQYIDHIGASVCERHD